MKITKEELPVRNMWESRIALSGLTPDLWVEGQVVKISEVKDFAEFLQEVRTHIIASINEVIASGKLREEFPGDVASAIETSWAHQETELPISVDIAILPDGTFRLADVAGESVASMINVSAAIQGWKDFHYEGDPKTICINHVTPAIQTAVIGLRSVKIIRRENNKFEVMAAQAVHRMLFGVSDIASATDEVGEDDGVLALFPWVNAFAELPDGNSLLQKFITPQSNVLQPAWTLAVETSVEVDDFDEASHVIRAWIPLNRPEIYPTMLVAVEEGKVVPVVMRIDQ